MLRKDMTVIVAEGKVYNVNYVREKVDAVNKRAKKLGLAPLVLDVGSDIIEEKKIRIDDFLDLYRTVTYIANEVKIHGEIPVIPGGWNLIGVIEHSPINFVKTVPGEEIPEIYFERCVCDHCRTERLRNKTIIVRNESGEYKQVGTTCVKDFLGINPNTLLYALELSEKDFFEEGGLSREEVSYKLEDYLEVCHAITQKLGWTSRTKSYETGAPATVDHVSDFYNPHSKSGAELRRDLGEYFTEETKQLVKDAIKWVETTHKDGDYFFNLKQLVNFGYVPVKSMALAASLMPVYVREMIKLKEEASKPESNWIGSVDSKIEVEAKFVGEFTFDSYYGVVYVKRFVDTSGNLIVWFTTSSNGFEVDKTYKIKGTVKKHDEYKGKKQTVLSRVKTC